MRHAAYVEAALRDYERVLQQQGPAGLCFLNARVRHRFTAVFQLRDGVLHNLYLHDKQGQVLPELLEALPLGESFCQLTLRDGAFGSSNTSLEHRLDGNRFQGVVGAYYGVPVVDVQGVLFGSLCHFDMDCHDISDAEFELLGAAAQMLSRYLGDDAWSKQLAA